MLLYIALELEHCCCSLYKAFPLSDPEAMKAQALINAQNAVMRQEERVLSTVLVFVLSSILSNLNSRFLCFVCIE